MSYDTNAIIFDMDGVIIDSEPSHERAYLDVVHELGYGENHGINFAHYVGRSDKELWVDFVNLHRPSQTLDELLALKSNRVIEIIQEDKPLFAGLAGLVKDLATRYRLALASGSDRLVVDEVLKLDGLRQHFQAVVSGSDIERGKPAPDIFLKTAALLGVEPRRCWVVEDSRPGVTAALTAGMKVIAITNTLDASELADATRVVETYEEIRALLLPDLKTAAD